MTNDKWQMTNDEWQVTSDKWRVTSNKWLTSAGASLQLVPMIMELVAPVKSQRLYLMVGTSCKLAPAEGINDKWLMTNL